MRKSWMTFRHIKDRLIVVYTSMFLIVMILFMGWVYYFVRESILEEVNQSLHSQIDAIRTTIETTADASIKNYFRARAWACVDVIESSYNRFQKGELSEAEAKAIAIEFVKAQKIGNTGYGTILNGEAIVITHPFEELESDLKEYPFVMNMISQEESFTQYEWKNPQDYKPKNKSMYTIHFEPWDWYVAMTGYQDELRSLVTLEDFEENILAIPFGNTGYPVVIGLDGTLLIHPTYKGVNMIDRNDGMGEVSRKAISERNGQTYYYWKNPGEENYRKKITVYAEVKGFDMVVAATAYESEFMKPLKHLQFIFMLAATASLLLVIVLTVKISQGITKPIIDLNRWISEAESGDLQVRAKVSSEDEISEIARSFNRLIETIQSKHQALAEQILINKEIAEELQASLTDLQLTQNKLVQHERFSSMGKMLAKVAHHLNTPLGSAMTTLSFLDTQTNELNELILSKKLNHSKLTTYIDVVNESIGIMNRSLISATSKIESIKAILLRSTHMPVVDISINDLIKNTYIPHWQDQLSPEIQLQVNIEDSVSIKTYPELMMVILNHLTENSIRHGFIDRKEGMIQLEIGRRGNGIQIVYKDNGFGIEQNDASQMFEPFYSPNDSFTGTGLGLYMVFHIVVQVLKGDIHYEGSERGVKYVIYIPSLILVYNEEGGAQ